MTSSDVDLPFCVVYKNYMNKIEVTHNNRILNISYGNNKNMDFVKHEFKIDKEDEKRIKMFVCTSEHIKLYIHFDYRTFDVNFVTWFLSLGILFYYTIKAALKSFVTKKWDLIESIISTLNKNPNCIKQYGDLKVFLHDKSDDISEIEKSVEQEDRDRIRIFSMIFKNPKVTLFFHRDQVSYDDPYYVFRITSDFERGLFSFSIPISDYQHVIWLIDIIKKCLQKKVYSYVVFTCKFVGSFQNKLLETILDSNRIETMKIWHSGEIDDVLLSSQVRFITSLSITICKSSTCNFRSLLTKMPKLRILRVGLVDEDISELGGLLSDYSLDVICIRPTTDRGNPNSSDLIQKLVSNITDVDRITTNVLLVTGKETHPYELFSDPTIGEHDAARYIPKNDNSSIDNKCKQIVAKIDENKTRYDKRKQKIITILSNPPKTFMILKDDIDSVITDLNNHNFFS